MRTLRMVLLAIFVASFSGAAHPADKDEQLIDAAKAVLGTLPAAMISEQNPITPRKVRLGKILFYESRISIAKNCRNNSRAPKVRVCESLELNLARRTDLETDCGADALTSKGSGA